MKRHALFAVVSLMATSVFATDYTWTGGGSSGKWDDDANWGGGGWPNGGDTATIGEAITITQDFILDAGDVTVLAAAKVTFNCAISGPGGFFNKGTGAIAFMKDNSFTGGVKTQSPDATTAASVELYAGGGLGTGAAYIEKDNKQRGSRLYVYGPMTVTTPITIGCSAGNSSPTLWVTNDVTFREKVSTGSRFVYRTAGGGHTITFNETGTIGGNWFPLVGRNDTVVYNEPVTCSSGADIYTGTAETDNGGHVVFKASGNYWAAFHVSSDSFVFDAENALPATFDGNSGKILFESDRGRIDIAGHNQKITCITKTFGSPTSYSNSGFTNSTDTAAIVAFEGLETGLTNLTFGGRLFGKTGLKWAPTSSSATFTFDTQNQPTTSDLIVSNGTVALVNGATFAALSKLQVSATGVLSFDATSGAGFRATELTVAAGGRIETGAKTLITVDRATVNGVALTTGSYGQDDLPGVVTGSGVIDVRGLPADVHAWTGEAENGKWSDPGNWGGELPKAGENILIESATVTLEASTPALKSLYLFGNAKLSVSNWNTKIEAEAIHAMGESVLTCANGGTTEDSVSRVWIACTDLQLGANARIDLDGKGYAPNPSGGSGKGPGAGAYRFGAGHGGPGGGNLGCGILFSLVYDDPADPSQPGSSGYWETRYKQTHGNCGGGVLKIEATGTVRIQGTVTANGESSYCSGGSGSLNDTAGSGGTINITCDRFIARNAVIRAEGGEGDRAPNPAWRFSGTGCGQPGGGGMIAIRYGSAQQMADVSHATISAACGLYTGTLNPVTLATQDKYQSHADLGTVWFSDRTLVDSTLGDGLSGRIVHPVGLATDGDLAMTNGYVRFEGEGVTVSIGGDLTIDGSYARLEVGGLCYTNRSIATDVYCGTSPVTLTVGGDLAVADGGRLDIRAAATNGVDRFGATLAVGGNFTVGDTAWVVTWCDVLNTGAPHMTVNGDFTVAAGGTVSATHRGASGGWNGGLYSPSVVGVHGSGFGLGGGLGGTAGSYGGRGGIGRTSTRSPGNAYGNAYYPSLPGSGGGSGSHGQSGNGGGLVMLQAAGAITVNGRIEADGDFSYYTCWDAIQNVAPGSGGAIFLSGRTFAGTGTLSANGGEAMLDWNTDKTSWYCSGAGGGGRIAVWTGEPVDESVRTTSYRVTSADTPIAGEGGFSGTVTANAGSPVYANGLDDEYRIPLADESIGEAGTVKFCKLSPKTGAMLIVR